MDVLQSLAVEVQTGRRKCEATTQQLDDQDAKVEELKLKVRLQTDETE